MMRTEPASPPAAPNLLTHVFFEDAASCAWAPFEPDRMPEPVFTPFAQERIGHPPDKTMQAQETDSGSGAGSAGQRIMTDLIWPAPAAQDEYLSRQHAQTMADLKLQHAGELDDLRQAHAEELSQKLIESVTALEVRLAEEMGARLSNILAPLLSAHAQKASLSALIAEIQQLLTSGKASQIKISGPCHLTETVRAFFSERAGQLIFEDADALDVTIDADSRLISSRLSEWQAALQEALA